MSEYDKTYDVLRHFDARYDGISIVARQGDWILPKYDIKANLGTWDKKSIVSAQTYLDPMRAMAVDALPRPEEGKGVLVLPELALASLNDVYDIHPDLLWDFYEGQGDFEYTNNYHYPRDVIYHGSVPDALARYAIPSERWDLLVRKLRKTAGWLAGDVRSISYECAYELIDTLVELADLAPLPKPPNDSDGWRWNAFSYEQPCEIASDASFSPLWQQKRDDFDAASELLDLIDAVARRERLALLVDEDEVREGISGIVCEYISRLSSFDSTMDAWKAGVPMEDILA